MRGGTTQRSCLFFARPAATISSSAARASRADAAVGIFLSFYCVTTKLLLGKMPPKKFAVFAFARLTELLRKREVPGAERREAQRQADFEARYCDTETEYCVVETEEESEEAL